MIEEIELLHRYNTVGLIRLKDLPEYSAWWNAIDRCENPDRHNYNRYGGRGISMCPEWRNDFWEFLLHIGRRPSPDLSLERINNALGYIPGNVKWGTIWEQANNKDHADNRGEKSPSTKLNDDDARYIRHLALTSKNPRGCMNQHTPLNSPSLREIGKMFGVSKRCVLDIKTGRTFGHLWKDKPTIMQRRFL